MIPLDPRVPFLPELERKVQRLSTWTIHDANHARDGADRNEARRSPGSSASSLAAPMSALARAVLRPGDRVAVKPPARCAVGTVTPT